MELGRDLVDAVNRDWRTAPVRPQVRAALGFIETLVTDPDRLGAPDVAAAAAAGVDRAALEQAVWVCVTFTMITRLADAFGWAIPSAEDFAASARMLLKRGYVL
ncbi:MAG: hypothetical protein H6709_14240 [Kofleriaceae bacterium]|nr:hypothetical protein [Kofleriaceae bacterium]MCB9573241.1 hypothetical protein [Kofleriaceae bacterium]